MIIWKSLTLWWNRKHAKLTDLDSDPMQFLQQIYTPSIRAIDHFL